MLMCQFVHLKVLHLPAQGARNERRLVAVCCSNSSTFEIMHGLLNRVMEVLGVPVRLPGQGAPLIMQDTVWGISVHPGWCLSVPSASSPACQSGHASWKTC